MAGVIRSVARLAHRVRHARTSLWSRWAALDRASQLALRGKPVASDRPDGLLRVRLRGMPQPLFVRPGSAAGSDASTVWELFCKHAYAAPVRFELLRAVVDLGANIGLFLPYLLRRGADVRRYLAVDADDASLAVLRVNLEHAARGRPAEFDARVESCAVGDRDGTVRFDTRRESVFHQVSADGDREVPMRRLTALLDAAGFGDVDLLKIDIEGGESAVLPTAGAWAPRVRRIVGELHGSLDLGWARRTLGPHGYVVSDWRGRLGDNFLALRHDCPELARRV